MKAPARFTLFALLMNPSQSQTLPDLTKILKHVSEMYKAASQYQIEADVTMGGAKAGSSASHVSFAFKAPDKYRMQGAIPGMDESDLGEPLAVDDGAMLWFYFPKSNQYGSIPASALTADALGDLGDLRPEAMDHFMMGRYRAAADSRDQAKYIREELIEIAGSKIDCFVVTVGSFTWWLDKKRNLVLREDSGDSSTVFTSIKLNESIPDDLFKFNPPPGARKLPARP